MRDQSNTKFNTKVSAKIDAARILSKAGWDTDRIAAATASKPDHVAVWLDPAYKTATHAGHATHGCWGCGSETKRLRNNGMCSDCTRAKHQSILDMLSQGMSTEQVADAVGGSRDHIRNIKSRANRQLLNL